MRPAADYVTFARLTVLGFTGAMRPAADYVAFAAWPFWTSPGQCDLRRIMSHSPPGRSGLHRANATCGGLCHIRRLAVLGRVDSLALYNKHAGQTANTFAASEGAHFFCGSGLQADSVRINSAEFRQDARGFSDDEAKAWVFLRSP
jgi:hypothetical protein